jgi:hypothetical protein
MELKKEQLKEEHEALQQGYLKDKDEPNSLGKKNKSIEEGVSHLSSELKKLEEQTR